MDYKIIILTPTAERVRARYTGSLVELLFYFMRTRIGDGEQSVSYGILESSGICSARERMVADHMAKDWTHVCFIDDDMGFAPDTLHILASRHKPIVGVNYPHRVPGMGFTAVNVDGKGRIETNAESTGIESCAYTGFGFCLIERSVFEQTEKPWFYLAYDKKADRYSTEDAWFCMQTRRAKIPWYVDHDASKGITHIGPCEFDWRDV